MLMKMTRLALMLLTVPGLLNALAVPSAAQSGSQVFRKGEVIVELKPGTSIDNVNARIGTTTIQRIYGTNFYRLATPKNKKENKYKKRLSSDPDVLSAALNPVVTSPLSVFGRSTFSLPDGHPTPGQTRPQYLSQQLIDDLDAVHQRSTGSGVIVAVIDTGIDRLHPDIASHMWVNPGEVAGDNIDNDGNGLVDDVNGWDFLANNNNPTEAPEDPQHTVAGHGTFIAGLIALVAPDAKIMSIRAFNPDGVSDVFTVAAAIKYATDKGARVINLSWGSSDDSGVLHDAITYASQSGALLVAAVGNDNKNTDKQPQFPANWSDQVISVAAVDTTNHKADFSNFGTGVDVAALGVKLFSPYPENVNPDYAMWSGTSFAAPLVSAEGALILQNSTHSTDVRGLIEQTATNIDALNPNFVGKLGKGRINPLSALSTFDHVVSNVAEIKLLPTAIEPSAYGKAEVEVTGTEQEFDIEAESLQPRTAYKIAINGTPLLFDGSPTVLASNYGCVEFKFSTNPHGDRLPLPAALNPVTGIQLVQVLDASDNVVLANTFGAPTGGGTGGGGGGGGSGDSGQQSVEKEATLQPNGTLPQASGRARAEIEAERQKLRVEASGLTSGTAYTVFADGVNLGSITAQSGYFRLELTSDGQGSAHLPTSLNPVTGIQKVEVHDPAGQIVLQGTFQAGGDDFGGDDHGGGSGGGGDDGGGSGGGGGTGGGGDDGGGSGGTGGGGTGGGGDDGGGSGGTGGGGDDGGGSGGGGSQSVHKEATLSPSSVIPSAGGRVRIDSQGSSESLEVDADHLASVTAYTVIVDGTSMGSFTTTGGGHLSLTWGTGGGDMPLPSQVHPVTNIRHVEIRDGAGQVVLSCDIPN